MANVLSKIKNFWTGDDEDDMDFEEEVEKVEQEEPVSVTTLRSSKDKSSQNNVVTFQGNGYSPAKIVIIKPEAYEEVEHICDEFKSKKIVVINTSNLDQRLAQRLLDTVGGAVYVLNGNIQDVERGIYILTPTNIEVSKELKNELSSRGLFSRSK